MANIRKKKRYDNVKEYIKAHPGITVGAICSKLKMDSAGTKTMLREMQSKKELECINDGKERWYIYGVAPNHAEKIEKFAKSDQGLAQAIRHMDRLNIPFETLNAAYAGDMDASHEVDRIVLDVFNDQGVKPPAVSNGIWRIYDKIADERPDLATAEICELACRIQEKVIEKVDTEFKGKDASYDAIRELADRTRDELFAMMKPVVPETIPYEEEVMPKKSINVTVKTVNIKQNKDSWRGLNAHPVSDEEYECREDLVVEYLRNNPGATVSEIAENHKVDPRYGRMSASVVYGTVRSLRDRHGTWVKCTKVGRTYSYFIGDVPEDITRRIQERLDYIRAHEIRVPEEVHNCSPETKKLGRKVFDQIDSIKADTANIFTDEIIAESREADGMQVNDGTDDRMEFKFTMMGLDQKSTTYVCTEKEAAVAADIIKKMLGVDIEVGSYSYRKIYSTDGAQ